MTVSFAVPTLIMPRLNSYPGLNNWNSALRNAANIQVSVIFKHPNDPTKMKSWRGTLKHLLHPRTGTILPEWKVLLNEHCTKWVRGLLAANEIRVEDDGLTNLLASEFKFGFALNQEGDPSDMATFELLNQAMTEALTTNEKSIDVFVHPTGQFRHDLDALFDV
jgi:hypothetical protein